MQLHRDGKSVTTGVDGGVPVADGRKTSSTPMFLYSAFVYSSIWCLVSVSVAAWVHFPFFVVFLT